MNPLAALIVPINRLKHLVQEPKRRRTVEATRVGIESAHERLSAQGLTELARAFNIALYLLVLEEDIAVLKHQALFAIRPWTKTFIARQFAVLIYEAANDLPQLLGKDFRVTLEQLPLTADDLESLAATGRAISRFKKKNQGFLYRTRNYLGAHRDLDARQQMAIVRELSLLQAMQAAAELYDALSTIHPLLTRCLSLASNTEVLVRHTARAIEKERDG